MAKFVRQYQITQHQQTIVMPALSKILGVLQGGYVFAEVDSKMMGVAENRNFVMLMNEEAEPEHSECEYLDHIGTTAEYGDEGLNHFHYFELRKMKADIQPFHTP